MPLPVSRTFAGLAKEVTKGTGVAPVDFIPIAKDLKPVDKVKYIDDDGLRGSMVDVYDQIQGPIWSEFDMNGLAYPDTYGYIVAAIFGDVTTTGASAPFSHAMSVKNSLDGQPGALSITDFYGLSGGTPARRYTACQCASLSTKFMGDDAISYQSKWVGFQSALVALPTNAPSTIPAVPGWRTTFTIAGAGKLFVMDCTIALKRQTTPIHTADGTQAPYAVWQGALSVEGDMTIIHEDDTELVRYLTNTQPSFVVDAQQGAGATLTEIKYQITKCAYVEGTIDRGKDFVTSKFKLKGIGNTTDIGSTGGFSPAKATIQSAKAASTYQ